MRAIRPSIDAEGHGRTRLKESSPPGGMYRLPQAQTQKAPTRSCPKSTFVIV